MQINDLLLNEGKLRLSLWQNNDRRKPSCIAIKNIFTEDAFVAGGSENFY
jgi:hypothetical protein